MIEYGKQPCDSKAFGGKWMRVKNLRHRILVSLIGTLAIGVWPAVAADAPLADAVMHRDNALVRSLAADRTALNAAQPDGTTALHWAVRYDDLATARLLVQAGADVKVVNRYGVTP